MKILLKTDNGHVSGEVRYGDVLIVMKLDATSKDMVLGVENKEDFKKSMEDICQVALKQLVEEAKRIEKQNESKS